MATKPTGVHCSVLQHSVDWAHKINLIVVQAYSNYGDIIRHTMGKCREISNTAFAKALLLSLQQEFEKLLDDNDGIADTNSKDFTAIKVKLLIFFTSFIHYYQGCYRPGNGQGKNVLFWLGKSQGILF